MINDIQIGPLTLHVYGIMVAIGFVSALMISEKRAKNRGMNTDILYGIFWCAIFGGAAGSKLLYYIVSFPDILKDPSILWNLQNGWVVYGGIIGGVLASLVYCRYKKADFVQYLDLVLFCWLLLWKGDRFRIMYSVLAIYVCTQWCEAGSYADLFQYW